jgi:Sigma-70, region 4
VPPVRRERVTMTHPDDPIRCEALLWVDPTAPLPAGGARCPRLATNRLSGDVVLCDLHAAALRSGRTVETAGGPVSGDEFEPLAPQPRRPPEWPNATREAFPEGLPEQPSGFDDRRWRVLRRRSEGATFATIGAELGVSRERARQVEESALRALNPKQTPSPPIAQEGNFPEALPSPSLGPSPA